MKKISFVATLILLALLTSCGMQNRGKNSIMKAWDGEYSHDKYVETIQEYKKSYTPIIAGGKESVPNVSIKTDFEIKRYRISPISKVDDTNENVELKSCIDLAVEAEIDGNTLNIPITALRNERHKLWSFFVTLYDENDVSHCYYFRVDYSNSKT